MATTTMGAGIRLTRLFHIQTIEIASIFILISDFDSLSYFHYVVGIYFMRQGLPETARS